MLIINYYFYKTNNMSHKTINCPIHGVITLTPRMCKIIDTPEYQRLHKLKQLGATHHVYPSATHTRFEHSLGVSYLAKVLLTSIKEKHPEFDIDDNFIELYQIAGLIHDIGHGPFSHLYDDEIIDQEKDMKHESRGINIFKDMVEKYSLSFDKRDIDFIIELIEPSKENENNWKYQIINNKFCAIDVDKVDYIQRDCYYLGFGINQKFERLLTMCDIKTYVFTDEQAKTEDVLAWPEKLQDEIISLFQTRYRLHKQVYTHHTVKAVEQIVSKILFEIKKSTDIDLSTSYDDIISFPYKNEIIKNLQRQLDFRQHPRLIGEETITIKTGLDPNSKLEISFIKLKKIVKTLNENDIPNSGIISAKIGFISGDGGNPLEMVPYFKKENHNAYKTSNYSSFMAPKNCQEYIYRIYVLNKTDVVKAKNIWDKKNENELKD
jgi:HD superfamily phosphohydrolase